MTLARSRAGTPVRMMPIRVLDAASVGGIASEALSHPSQATVLASFERSFYLDLGGALITVGDHSLHDGPLNLRLAGRSDAALAIGLGIEVGQRWMTSPDRLRRSDGLTVKLTDAAVWRPNIPSGPLHPSQLRQGLVHLLALLQDRDLENGGLISLILQDTQPRTATERAAKPPIDALKAGLPHWLLDDIPPDPAPLVHLLGLGPGLTPSGDDLLAGIMIAWHQIGARRASRHVGKLLLEACAARTRTTPISQAHLMAAAKGYGAAPLHCLLNAVAANSQAELADALDAAAKIGHSSGLDAIAGMVLALNAWLLADDRAPVIA